MHIHISKRISSTKTKTTTNGSDDFIFSVLILFFFFLRTSTRLIRMWVRQIVPRVHMGLNKNKYIL